MRKPSAALVVASAALVMATIGTSVAATGYTITSAKQIKPGSISLASLSKSARKALRGARGPEGPVGDTGDDGADGADGVDGADGEAATKLWAQILADGSVNASSPGVKAVNSSAGVYYVTFGQDITHCAALATQASIPNFSRAGLATTGIAGPAFVAMNSAGIDLAPNFPSVSSAAVQTRRTNGTLASTSFSIAVFC
jgi:hypothetical protein